MNKYLEQLVALSQVDKELDEFEPKITQANKILKDTHLKIAKFDEDCLKLDEEIKTIKLEQNQNNLHITEFSERLKDISKKSASIKTEKELNALKIEEDIVKEQLDAANDDIIKLDKILESKESLKQELQEQIKKEQALLVDINAEVASKMKELEKERNLIYEKKSKLTSTMNQKILSFYEKIRKWAKNSAVVPVKKQACYGCFMKIYDKTYLAVQKGEEIVTCPHCGRILYKDESPEKSEKNQKEVAESLS
ncbi:hypothetical protein DMB95_05050 [Campylobacter sp. MIT 12-8780]|uniref:zinc ribbon domain-containing protein n=1 Tax=unclassified Campylobacter TaxID=2593542 RepID=UPI0010F85644|nr:MULTISPECIES: zinc ribbon domain-containing protein [unclassified Campylobacter]NDJ27472.1 hypothetical protein [Campylobacter sp. MIT 19-121]TKX28748.1 hypothetical protein CQA38_06255 [Campylobacter sp. MIT 12-5580]TQR41231.1 hypothetical protein DMB95_05050 [Campylobacter sp. MIT 12-8780]